jgi:hypothetical protein
MKKIFFMFLILFSISFAGNYKLIETETVKGLKYSTKVIVDFDEKISHPTEEEFDKIGSEIIQKNPNYESYFINYYYPGMDMESANLASTIKQDGEQKTEVLLWTLSYDEFYSKYVAYDKEGNLYWCGLKCSEMKEEEVIGDTPFDVTFSVKIETDNDLGTKVIINTNLPEGTLLNVSLYPGNHSEDIYVDSNGIAETTYFNIYNGTYDLSIVSIAESLQENENVRKIFGKDGKNLRGEYIQTDLFGTFLEYDRTIKLKRNF